MSEYMTFQELVEQTPIYRQLYPARAAAMDAETQAYHTRPEDRSVHHPGMSFAPFSMNYVDAPGRPLSPVTVAYLEALACQWHVAWEGDVVNGMASVRFENPPDTPLEEWNTGVDALLAACAVNQGVWEVPE